MYYIDNAAIPHVLNYYIYMLNYIFVNDPYNVRFIVLLTVLFLELSKSELFQI